MWWRCGLTLSPVAVPMRGHGCACGHGTPSSTSYHARYDPTPTLYPTLLVTGGWAGRSRTAPAWTGTTTRITRTVPVLAEVSTGIVADTGVSSACSDTGCCSGVVAMVSAGAAVAADAARATGARTASAATTARIRVIASPGCEVAFARRWHACGSPGGARRARASRLHRRRRPGRSAPRTPGTSGR